MTTAARIFLGWERSFAESVARQLWTDPRGGLPDFSDQLILVPTARSARRLREGLIVTHPEGGEGIFPPAIKTPARLLNEGGGLSEALDRRLIRRYWEAALDGLGRGALSYLVGGGEEISSEQVRAFARRLEALHHLLAETDLDFSTAADRLPSNHPDYQRWSVFRRVEEGFRRRLRAAGLEDPGERVREGRDWPTLLAGYRRVVLAGLPDPNPLVLKHLETLRASVRVEIWMGAPETEAAHFDEWGRPLDSLPLEGLWNEKEESLKVHVSGAREPLAALLRPALMLHERPEETLCPAMADDDLKQSWIEAHRDTPTPFYDPDGIPWMDTVPGRFFRALFDLRETRTVEALHTWIRHPYFQSLSLAAGFHRDPEAWLEGLDNFSEDHLTYHLETARNLSSKKIRGGSILGDILKILDPWLFEEAGMASFNDRLWSLLQPILRSRRLEKESSEALAWETLFNRLRHFRAQAALFEAGSLSPWASLREWLTDEQVFPAAGAEALPVYGWLEVLWDPRPHLLLGGFHEANVPGPSVADGLLPESLKRQLGLPLREDKYRVDRYIFRFALEARRENGQVDIGLYQWSADGTRQYPSRILFEASEPHLVDAVRSWMPDRPMETSFPSPEASTGWQAPAVDPPETISVTAFRSYLACPFRFFLDHVLGLRPGEPGRYEMDGHHFGNLAHAVVEACHRESPDFESDDPAVIENLVFDQLERLFAEQFGEPVPLALRFQKEVLAERFGAFAADWAASRAEGWRARASEWCLHEELDFDLEGLSLRGKIDLIEENIETGAWRVIDFKTADSAQSPGKHHVARVTSATQTPDLEEAVFEMNGKPHVWRDLQLPLYLHAVMRHWNFTTIPEAGYWNLAKTAESSGLELWRVDPETLQASIDCARAVARSVREGLFWPPAGSVRHDEWNDYFLQGIEAMMTPKGLKGGAS